MEKTPSAKMFPERNVEMPFGEEHFCGKNIPRWHSHISFAMFKNIENVRTLTDDTVQGAAEMSDGLHGLQTYSENLTTVVNQFKV